MRIGLFFGSFNPIHHGHLILANYLYQTGLIDQVWFIVSPQNPFKLKSSLIDEYIRLHLVKLAIDGVPYFRVSDIEFKLTKPSYTIDTLRKLAELYPDKEFSLIVGSDSYENIPRWKSGDSILNEYKILIYRRLGSTQIELSSKSQYLDASPIIEISSTDIREMVKRNQSIRYYVPENVVEEIAKSGLYKK